MKIVCTYCSGEKRKDGGMLPAVRRYRSERISGLAQASSQQGLSFMILSGEFGLVGPEHPLPWYDHLLQPDEVDTLAGRVAAALRLAGVREVEFHTAAPEKVPQVRPYQTVMTAACARADVGLRVVIIEGNPA